MDKVTDPKKVRSGRIKLVAILGAFMGPFLLAIMMYVYYRDGGDLETSNHGELVWPAIPLKAFIHADMRNANRIINLAALGGRWTLVYPQLGDCTEVCQQNTYHMRQIHRSLGKEAHRLQRLLLSNPESGVLEFIVDNYPRLWVANIHSSGGIDLPSQLTAAAKALAPRQDSFYLVDPLGNVMMRFSSQQNPKGVLKDIKKALRASRIG